MTTPSVRTPPVPRRRRFTRALVGWSLFGVGCSNLLGIPDDNNKVDCLTTADCGVGFVCENTRCVCTTCGHGGSSGVGGTGGSLAGQSGESPVMSSSGAGGAHAGTGGASAGTGGTTHPVGAGGTGGSSSAVGGEAGESGRADGAGAGGQAGAAGECDPTVKSCLVCDDTRSYVDRATPCAEACRGEAECVSPPSCDGIGNICAAEDCCQALPISKGNFDRSCDDSCRSLCWPNTSFPASVESFSLDKFETTVARFRKFVNAYPASKPLPGAGKNPHDDTDTGWDERWTAQLPETAQALRDELASTADCDGTWTPGLGGSESLPMNCVSWYEALAFCIWDGGRLPTEAEWDYAASGGNSRVYPWSDPPESTSIDATRAVYGMQSPMPIGSHPAGDGRWGHSDLAGNVSEWVWDPYSDCYVVSATSQKVLRGGAYNLPSDYVTVATRSEADASSRSPLYGFRCARDL